MKKIVALTTLVLLLTLGLARAALAGCTLCVDSVTAQTRDGAAWQSGQPVMLTFAVSRASADLAFPGEGLAVVMFQNKNRIKCLNVNLKMVGQDGDTARYAGAFHPFSEGSFDGKFVIGQQEPQDFQFDLDSPPTVLTQQSTAAQPEAAARTAPAGPAAPPLGLLPLAVLASLLLALPLALRFRRAG